MLCLCWAIVKLLNLKCGSKSELALLHPRNSGVVYFFQNTAGKSWMFAVDLRTRRVAQ